MNNENDDDNKEQVEVSFVEVWEVFRYMPLLQFGGLTGLLVLVMAGRLGWPVLVGAWKKRRGVEV